MKNLSIDIETFSSENLTKCGVYRYAEALDFEVLLFGYSADGAPVKAVDFTARRNTSRRCPLCADRPHRDKMGIQRTIRTRVSVPLSRVPDRTIS